MLHTINFKKQNADAGLSIIEMIVVIAISAYYILPSMSNAFSTTIQILLAVSYLMYVFFKNGEEQFWIFTFLCISVFLALLYAIFTDSGTISVSADRYYITRFVSKFYQFLIMFLPAFITMRIAKIASYKQKLFLLIVAGIMIIYIIVATMQEIQINPDITRSWQQEEEATANNIASYAFVYVVPILVGTIVMMMLKNKRIWIKGLCLLLIAFLFVFLIQAQYTLALMIAVIGAFLGFLKAEKSVVAKIIGLAIVLLFLLFMADILAFLASKIQSQQMSLRIREVANFFSSGDASGYNLNGRMTLYWRTVKAFLASPFIGNRSLDFDGHATFLTVLSDLGLLGGIPYYGLYFYMKKKLSTVISDGNKYFTVPFIMLFIMGFTNPIHAAFPVGYSVWFVVPLIIMVIQNDSNSEVMENEKMGD